MSEAEESRASSSGSLRRPAAERRSRPRLRSVALPVEHGGWGFLAEPLALGLLVAPSAGGAGLAVATAALFLVRHPARLAWRRRADLGSRRGRTTVLVAGGYGAAAAVAVAAAVATAGWRPLVPLALAAPLLAVFASYDLRYEGRRLLPELAAPAGLAAAAPAIALAGGWPADRAAALWLLLLTRGVPSVLYVRARLRAARGRPGPRRTALVLHGLAVAAAAALAWAGLGPSSAIAATGALAGRALAGLAPGAPAVPAKRVGFAELGWGAFFVSLTAAGYRLGL